MKIFIFRVLFSRPAVLMCVIKCSTFFDVFFLKTYHQRLESTCEVLNKETKRETGKDLLPPPSPYNGCSCIK